MKENWEYDDNSSSDFDIDHLINVTVEDFKEILLSRVRSGYRDLLDDELLAELLMIEDPQEAFDYMVNHPYWGRVWSINLLSLINGLAKTDSQDDE